MVERQRSRMSYVHKKFRAIFMCFYLSTIYIMHNFFCLLLLSIQIFTAAYWQPSCCTYNRFPVTTYYCIPLQTNSESFEFLANAIVATIDSGVRADSMKDLPKASLQTPEVSRQLHSYFIFLKSRSHSFHE